MKYVVELPEHLYVRVSSLIQRRGLISLSQVVQAALENQLELEGSEEGPVAGGTEPIAQGAGPLVTAGRLAPWEGIRLDDLHWDLTAEPAAHLAAGPVWGQVNRILPMKVGLRVLSSELSNSRAPVSLQRFHESATARAVRARFFLAARDADQDLPRGERLSAAFPEDTEKSRSRFQAHFLGRVLRDKRVAGALPEYGFINISSENGQGVVLTDSGLQFARLKNPVLDASEPTATALSAEEVEFLLAHLHDHMKEEFGFMTTLLRWIAEGSDKPDDLTRRVQKAWPQWSSKVANTMRAGALGRMHDLRLIGRQKDGTRVTYVVQPSGNSLVGQIMGENDAKSDVKNQRG